jgi:hypothetical protein
MIEYKSREYCKDTGCLAYKNPKLFGIDDDITLSDYCNYINECHAYKFHKWLQKNDYKIVKSKILTEHQEMDSEFEGISEMIEFRPENAPIKVLNNLLDDIKDIADTNYGKWRDV